MKVQNLNLNISIIWHGMWEIKQQSDPSIPINKYQNKFVLMRRIGTKTIRQDKYKPSKLNPKIIKCQKKKKKAQ